MFVPLRASRERQREQTIQDGSNKINSDSATAFRNILFPGLLTCSDFPFPDHAAWSKITAEATIPTPRLNRLNDYDFDENSGLRIKFKVQKQYEDASDYRMWENFFEENIPELEQCIEQEYIEEYFFQLDIVNSSSEIVMQNYDSGLKGFWNHYIFSSSNYVSGNVPRCDFYELRLSVNFTF